MVNIGFICEGFTEELILESEKFHAILRDYNINNVGLINVRGNGNLLPHRILQHQEFLFEEGASKIVILTDLDQDECITKTKLRITEFSNQIIIIAVKQIESWFLADNETMSKILDEDFVFEFPENEDIPIETIRKIHFEKFKRGIVGKDEKIRLARKMLKNGFSIQNAANHPNCPSAKYFLTKLQSIVNN
jgi:hypothetical protein